MTVKNFALENKKNNLWPDSEAAIWALRAHAPENGFQSAFITVGRRVLIDIEKFWELVKRKKEE